MAHDESSDKTLDVERLAFVAEKSLLAVRLDSEADECADSAEAARLHATADQARTIADIEIKLEQLRRGRSESTRRTARSRPHGKHRDEPPEDAFGTDPAIGG